jgi:hypothetical protein
MQDRKLYYKTDRNLRIGQTHYSLSMHFLTLQFDPIISYFREPQFEFLLAPTGKSGLLLSQ